MTALVKRENRESKKKVREIMYDNFPSIIPTKYEIFGILANILKPNWYQKCEKIEINFILR